MCQETISCIIIVTLFSVTNGLHVCYREVAGPNVPRRHSSLASHYHPNTERHLSKTHTVEITIEVRQRGYRQQRHQPMNRLSGVSSFFVKSRRHKHALVRLSRPTHPARASIQTTRHDDCVSKLLPSSMSRRVT